jgi:hypothetical protein
MWRSVSSALEPLDLITLLVHAAMVPATEHGEIRQRRRAALGPMPNVMALTEPDPAPWKATASVPMVQRPTDGRWDCTGPRPDLHDIAVPIAAHHNAARVARQALRRFRGNARAPFEDRLARRITVGQHGRVDMDHDLVALAGRPGIDAVAQRRLRDERKGVGLLVFEERRFRGNVHEVVERLRPRVSNISF